MMTGRTLVSVDYDNWRHGTESANMKGDRKEDGDGGLDPCLTDDCGNQCSTNNKDDNKQNKDNSRLFGW